MDIDSRYRLPAFGPRQLWRAILLILALWTLAVAGSLAQAQLWPIAWVHTGLWALGVLGIFLGARQMRQSLSKQSQAESEANHEAAFTRFNPDPVLELSAAGEINSFNAVTGEMARALGLANAAQMLPPSSPEMVRECLATGQPKLRVETQIGPRVISWSFFPVKFSNTVHCYGGDITERKRAETALIRLAAIIESSEDTIIGKDLNSIITSWNKGAEKLFGYTANEMIGTSIMRLIPADRHDEENQILGRITRGERVEHFETLRKDKDGRLIEVSVTVSPIKDATGKVIGVSKVARDITERRQAEAALRRSEAKFRTLYDSTSDAVMLLDQKGFFDCNQAALAMFGCGTREEFCSKHPADVSPPVQPDGTDSLTLAKQHMARAMEKGSYQFEWMHKRIDTGETFPAEVLLCALELDGKRVLQGSVRDITERKRSEESLRLQTAALEAAANGVVITDPKGTILWVNPAFTQLTGYSAEEAIGRNPRFLRSGQHPESYYKAMWQTISTARVWKGELINRRKDGQLYDEEMIITPVRDRAGAVLHFVAIKQDITERKEAETSLAGLQRQLLDASREAGMAEIATNVLHNVGNVLNSVNISTSLIVQSVKKSRVSSLTRVVLLLQEHAHDLGEFITNDSRGKHVPAHLAQLSEHLLAEQETNLRELASLRRNVEHIKEIVAMQQNYATFGGVKEMVNVADLVEDSLRLNEGAFSRHDVEVIREFETVPPMNLEKHKFLQIMVNLLRNAKHACQDSKRADKRLTVRVANGDGRVRISVMDNGVGVPPENLTHIFNHGFTTRKDGHGFGLHSGALAANEMGGSLTVHSDGIGQGAAFTLELPCPTRENSHE